MNRDRFERLLALSGIAYAALLVIAALAFPMPPGGDDSPARNPAWLAAHQSPVALQGYVRALAALAFVLLALAVSQSIRRKLGEGSLLARIALLGGVLCGLMLLLTQAVGIGAEVASHEHAGSDVVRALGYLQDGVLALSSLPAVGLFAAAGAAFLRERIVPRWMAWLTLAGVPLAVLDAASFTGSPFEAVGFLGLVYFLVWSLAIGITLLTPARNDLSHAQPVPLS